MSERLNCPFCNSDNVSDGEILTVRDGDSYKQSQCMDCGATGPEALVDGPDYGDVAAIAAWNRRAPTASAGEVTDAMVATALLAFDARAIYTVGGRVLNMSDAMRAALAASPQHGATPPSDGRGEGE
jgi:hypothetical protein